MKPILYLKMCIFFLISVQMFSQENTTLITYKISNNVVMSDEQKKSTYTESIKNVLKSLNNLEYILEFNSQESIFKENKSMILNEDKNSFTAVASKILGGVEGVFYRNKKTKEILYQKESFSKLFLIDKTNVNENWTLTKETKKIGNYNCYKARLTETYLGRSGRIIEREIIAWYALAIPVPFGPLHYGNLPGLILELEKGKFVYYVTRIKYNQVKDLKITKPTKGQKVTQQQYDSITRKLIDNRREYLSKN